jgi:hypothetical protein
MMIADMHIIRILWKSLGRDVTVKRVFSKNTHVDDIYIDSGILLIDNTKRSSCFAEYIFVVNCTNFTIQEIDHFTHNNIDGFTFWLR